MYCCLNPHARKGNNPSTRVAIGKSFEESSSVSQIHCHGYLHDRSPRTSHHWRHQQIPAYHMPKLHSGSRHLRRADDDHASVDAFRWRYDVT